MKVVQYDRFGGIEVLGLSEMNVPAITADQILVKVKAVSINPMDWKIRKGEMKLMSGRKFPKRVGADFAGWIESIGSNVHQFQQGDEVFGVVNLMKEGALGEYVAVSATSVWKKPASLNFLQAASIPVVGCGAHMAMLDIAGAAPGKSILINGATGGMGMFALQLAKLQGAQVTAVSSGEGLQFAARWGADEVIDYTKSNVLAMGKRYDVIFDLAGKMGFTAAKNSLTRKSVFINPVPKPIQIITTPIVNLFSSQKNKVLLSGPNDRAIGDLLKAIGNGLEIVVSKSFSMDQVKEAYAFAEKGGYIGKLAFAL